MKGEPGQDQNQASPLTERQRTGAMFPVEEKGIWGWRGTGKAL